MERPKFSLLLREVVGVRVLHVPPEGAGEEGGGVLHLLPDLLLGGVVGVLVGSLQLDEDLGT